MKNGIWKIIAILLMGIVLTGAAGWLTFGQKVAKLEGQYVSDRRHIDHLAESVKDLERVVARLDKSVVRLNTILGGS